MKRKAFTLIELLTVMAITGVLLTLIVIPIFQSFNLTRTAQAFADAQDKGRLLTQRISAEVGNAVSVRDVGSTVAPVLIPNQDPADPNSYDYYDLPYTKLDLISPAQGDPGLRGPGGGFIDPNTGKEDPTLTRPKGDIRLPVAPGMTMTRWFVGLNDPTKPYNEPYTGLLMTRNGSRDNLFVLRRAEVQPFVYRLRKDGAGGTMAWRPNLKYFRSDDDPGTGADFDRRIIDLDDPYFFVRDGRYLPENGPGRVADNGTALAPGKNARVDNWAATSVVQTEISRYDMVRPQVQGTPPKIVLTGGKPTLVPLVQFRPTRVSAAPAEGSAATRPGEAGDGLDRVGPDTYKTERGLWSNAIVRYYSNEGPSRGGVELAAVNVAGGISINTGAYSGAGLDGIAAPPNNFVLFDLITYERRVALGQAYPFTAAAYSADATDLLPGFPGIHWTASTLQRQLFTPFRVFTATGKIVSSFGIEEVGENVLGGTSRPNLPSVSIPAGGDKSPALDSGVGASLYSYDSTYNPNAAFNRLWNAYPELQGTLHRFIDLRFVRNEDGTLPPLCPIPADGKVQGFSFDNGAGRLVNRVRIVPGSDEVYGPDQTPGENYGVIVRYSRVVGNPGPNQYRLVYADMPEPVNYADLGLPSAVMAGFDPMVYNPTNVASAVIQPRYKAGYLQLCSDPNVPIPATVAGNPARTGQITVKYRFMFNGPKDAFAVDHDTREVMQVLLTIKNYPQSNAPNAQTVTLKSTATLRNALR